VLVDSFHAVDHKNPRPKWPQAMVDWLTIPSMIAARMTTKTPAASQSRPA